MPPSFRSSIAILILSTVRQPGCIRAYTRSRTVTLRRLFVPSCAHRSLRPVQNRVNALETSRRHIGSSLLDTVTDVNSDLPEVPIPMPPTSLQPQRSSLRRTLKVLGKLRSSNNSNVQVVGHRGAIYQYLENTMESFLYCANTCRCNAVELDVFVIKDGTLVVFHGCDSNPNIPGSLQGYCMPGAPGDLVLANDGKVYRSIIDLTYEETQQLQFNPDFEEFVCPKERIGNAKIPRLRDVLHQLSKTDLQEVKIELKGPGTVQPVLTLVEELKLEALCSYSSFDHTQLQELRTLRPNKSMYRTGALFNAPICNEEYLHRALWCGATAIHLRYDECTVDRIQAVHDHNFISMAWMRGPMGMANDAYSRFDDIGGGGDLCDETNSASSTDSIIENEDCYRALLDTGVQQICCNRPDLLMKILSEN